jgi:drug/metabolite transporter (DMT)-like permease
MIFVFICLALSTSILLFFREFGRRGWETLPIIAVNYLVCVACAACVDPGVFAEIQSAPAALWPLGLLQGGLFIGLFQLTARAVSVLGLALTAIAVRLSLLIPVGIAAVWWGESFTVVSGIGVAFACGGLFFLTPRRDPQPGGKSIRNVLVYAAILFLGTGWADTNFKIFDRYFLGPISGTAFTVLLFGVAGVLAWLWLGKLYWTRGQTIPKYAWFAGLVLGIPNYFSVYFMIEALDRVPASVYFPVNNVGVILLAAVLGAIFWGETLTRRTSIGLVLATVAIGLLALA